MSQHVVVTGGAGFIGSHLVARLLEEGNDVTVVDTFTPYYDPNVKRANLAAFTGHKGLRLIEKDICDTQAMRRAFEGADAILHNAAQAGVRVSVEDPLVPHHINATGTLSVLEAARAADVGIVVNGSSSSIYGRVDRLPIEEPDPKRPMSPYGVSKLAAEEYCRVFRTLYGMRTCSLRYFTVFGPRMRPDLAISIFTKACFEGRPIEVFGDGTKSRDFTFVENVVQANMLALKKRTSGEFNIGSSERFTIRGLVDMVRARFPGSPEPSFSADKPGDAEHTWASIRSARDALGYEPTVRFEKGLDLFVQWYKAGRTSPVWAYA